MSEGRGEVRRSLRAQLGLYTASILIPGLLCMSVLLLVSVNAARRSHEQELLATARAVSASIDQRLTRALAYSEAIATSEGVRRQDWPGVAGRVGRLVQGGSWALVVDDQGRQIFNTNSAARQPRPAFPLPDNIRKALETGRSQVSNLFFAPGVRRHLVSVDTPLRAGGRDYSLSYLIGPEQLVADFSAVQTPKGALITLVDRDFRVVARSRLHQKFIGAHATAYARQAMTSQREGVIHSPSLEGTPSIAAFSRSPISGWTTLVVVPRSQFEAPLWSSLIGVGLVAVLAGLGAIAAAHQFVRTIARELRLLQSDAVAVGHGQDVAPRAGSISNFAEVQAALSEASRELRLRGERQRLMINELNHRVKNTLATVQSLAMQTFRGDDPDARVKFDQRLDALAYGHDLLTKRNWEQVELDEIVARGVAMNSGQVSAAGPPVTLQPQAALALCMCLHELMTNSAKYGALSAPSGSVEVKWERDPASNRLRLEWRERGGPRVEPPRRSGFGTRLIDRLMRHELAGQAERRFEPDGLVFTADIELGDASRWRNDFSGDAS